MTKIKFCKALSTDDIHLAERLSVDFAGVHAIYEDYDLSLPLPRLSRMIDATNVILVALTKDVNPRWMDFIVKELRYQYVQIHTRIDALTVDILHRYRALCQFIMVVDPSELENITYLNTINSVSDFILFDYSEGGTGVTINVDRVKALLPYIDVPFFIAGGLNSDNVGGVIRALAPFAVDVQSSIRENKQWNEIKAISFVHSVREAM